jgi:NO-binding membrane sensor protein with MHYT domain
MLSEFFEFSQTSTNQLVGHYDARLVILSYLVAVFASYVALDLTARLREAGTTITHRLLWLIGGSIAMGAGIWSMHFIGMLSFSIPTIKLRYDLIWTGLSLVVAIFASGFALLLLQISRINFLHFVTGGVILGLAIASMHYSGMEALWIILNIRYLPDLFLLSIAIAIVASIAALWLAIKSSRVVLRVRNRVKLISAIIMGIAICGMHYTGMAASIFTLCTNPQINGAISLDPAFLATVIASVTFIILGVAFFASSYKESLNQEQFEKARQLGMAEIAASTLHNVGNVLNSVNVSAHTVSEKIASSKLNGLDKLSMLLNENKQNLTQFFTEDMRGKKIVEYLNNLTEYRQEEQRLLTTEMIELNKNLQMIKDIISTQQDLSKTAQIEQVTSINDLLDEALLITGLKFSNNICINKHYGDLKTVKLDKIKLLQVFVNLLRNAKDALMESAQTEKHILIHTAMLNNEKILIEITDNGIGISPKNLNRIFNYGFTTKASGHGFGLHTSALAINTLGGEIKAYSKGPGTGTQFTIKLESHAL